jgi:hypothetical protein
MSLPPTVPTAPEIHKDLTEMTQDERMELSFAALVASGTKLDGKPNLSIRNTALLYDVPRSTLNDRWNGIPTRKEGHRRELLLTSAQEEVLVEWIKVMGRRGIPLTATTLADYVTDIVGHAVGESWVRRFKTRHPELKVKWSSTLERCRAASLNPTLVNEFYNLLEDTIKTHLKTSTTWMRKEFSLALGRKSKLLLIVTRRMYTPFRMATASSSQLLKLCQLMDRAFSHRLSIRGSVGT